jgi:hypothetical protein
MRRGAHAFDEGVDLIGRYQVDGAAAKAAAHHARAEYARRGQGGFGQHIELHAAHFVVVAQAGVAGVHLAAEGSQVACY